MTALQAIALLAVALLGTIVTLARDPARQALCSSVFGMSLAVLFFAFQAPDVALSQIVVGTVALPAMILLALGRINRRNAAGGRRR
jgi:energy-converting hydrogenase B subunit D